jgi:hypothetical protein
LAISTGVSVKSLSGDVPVVGHVELEAAARTLPEMRRQEAALALFLERKRGIRQRQQRGVIEAHAQVAPAADRAVEIEIELARLDAPVLLAWLAGRVIGILEVQPVARQEFEPGGVAAGGFVAPDVVRLLGTPVSFKVS